MQDPDPRTVQRARGGRSARVRGTGAEPTRARSTASPGTSRATAPSPKTSRRTPSCARSDSSAAIAASSDSAPGCSRSPATARWTRCAPIASRRPTRSRPRERPPMPAPASSWMTALATVSAEHREAFLLVEVFGLSYQEVCRRARGRGRHGEEPHVPSAPGAVSRDRRRRGGDPVNCRHVQPLLSARMDGEHLSSAQRAGVDAHVASCASCRTFEERSARVRTAVRIRPAERVPDLTEAIMAGVAREGARGARPLARRPPSPRWNRLVPAIAAAIAGMLVGSLLVGGPWRGGPPAASAASIARAIRQVAPSVEAFQGSYLIREHGLDPTVPDRQLQMDVAFLAPQRFRLDVRDLTSYPSAAWTPTDLTYLEDMPATYQSGPTGCPATLPPADCPPTRTVISHASSYSAAAPLPADLIAPIATFGSSDGVVVTGHEDVEGHATVRVEMSFARAAPLFPFLRLGGTWRPMFEGDRVVLWLDTTGWFPVRYEVFPSADPDRRAWEMRFGLPHEQADTAIMDVTLQSVSGAAPDPSVFAIPGLGRPESVPLADAERRLGYLPVLPGDTGHLDLTSLIAPRRGPGLAELGPGLHGGARLPADQRGSGVDRARAVRSAGRGRTADRDARRRRRAVRTGRRRARPATRDPRRRHRPVPRDEPAQGRAGCRSPLRSRCRRSRYPTHGASARTGPLTIEQITVGRGAGRCRDVCDPGRASPRLRDRQRHPHARRRCSCGDDDHVPSARDRCRRPAGHAADGSVDSLAAHHLAGSGRRRRSATRPADGPRAMPSSNGTRTAATDRCKVTWTWVCCSRSHAR